MNQKSVIVCNKCDEHIEITKESMGSDICPFCKRRYEDSNGKVLILEIWEKGASA